MATKKNTGPSFEQIMTDLKNKIYKPIYFLMGEEGYFIDEITDYILENVLAPAERDFNQTIVYGKDVEAGTVINLAKRYPMMSNYQVVVIREAQNIKELEENLAHYVEKPLNSTLLVINYKYKTIDGRKKIGKLIEKTGVLFDSKKLYDNQIPAWIQNQLKNENCTISPIAAQLLTDFLGTDLSKIQNELKKLILTLPKDSRNITPEHIEKNIGISKDFNVFELCKALNLKDVLKANSIILHLSKNPKENPIIITINTIFMNFNRLLIYHTLTERPNDYAIAAALGINPFFLNDYKTGAKNYSLQKVIQIISETRNYDMKAKGVGTTSVDELGLMQELVFKILH
ncbi:MAG: DNA polymerase III subunit delta [Bacteroidetes bacterium RIFOXYA12_FULL_35_11]|nr:MAG: DNA polymerase III subunit delta [Bacteroidetes bacterium GWF2_35_48]OFY74680.1 MAG: DNA polymerase III subunit delta [Bacteroidetes bacterium RIFOXYA12_FULL_35_11]OFZ02221.1 MAG: DNA polymerase III subunit delta [Bacteroidetes bacterium RIFOXYC12_FULL_35_7]HBX49906.1 DNA polymerase III subunit delta [Bacteroidales bacterium]